ncbi:type II toxin-antitoxin system Phd/YefM family antitoxin [Candidatus Palauibacter sp.]|uniref:type II toxin-antitoxin system Phd/YefM family antitoxin n=1 Tax=Candidatus Palauibacter sp. TaxID=3101350 RepID=UPI003AF2744F
MRRASVSEAKNALSSLLSDVRRGEAVLITHRGKPVARIEPCAADDLGADQAAAELVRRGVAAPPRTSLNVERFLSTPAVRMTEGASASEMIVAERREGR